MAIEIIGVILFAYLMEISNFIRHNAALLFFGSIFLTLWMTGVITVVRRWRAE
jgi:hypothetical protein